MAKMRVHELAKEIDKNNKEILDVLQANGVNVQSPLSVIDDDQADIVRQAYAPKPVPKPEPEPKPEPKPEAEAAPKKRITAVFRSQNSSQAGKGRTGARPAGPAGMRRAGGGSRQGTSGQAPRQAGARPTGAASGNRPVGSGQPRASVRPVGPKPAMKPAPQGAADAAAKMPAAGKRDGARPEAEVRTQQARPVDRRTLYKEGQNVYRDGVRPVESSRRQPGDRPGQRSSDGARRQPGDRPGQRSGDGTRRPAGERGAGRISG